MFRSLSRKRRFGFTLVEVLVTTVVIGVLAAVVLPALARQTSAADPARIASDLNNIKMGIEVFSNNVRPDYPGDLEDLVNQPTDQGGAVSTTTDDLALDGDHYANRSQWRGPYVAQTLPAFFGDSGDLAWRAGASGNFENKIVICDLAALAACTTTTPASPFVTVIIKGLGLTEANELDQMLDGAVSGTAGMFRFDAAGSPAYYYTIPYVQ